MKKIIVFLLLIIANNFYAQYNDLYYLEFKGKIKTIESYLNNVKTKSIQFNEDGNILFYTSGNNLDIKNIKSENIYYSKKYDDKGREIYYKDDILTTIKKYDDSLNSILEYTIRNLKKDTTHLYFYQFDNNKNKTLDIDIEYNANQRYIERSVEYKYDSLNRLITEINISKFYRSNTKKIINTKNYIYENGLIKKIVTNNKGEEYVTENFKFPSKTPLYKNIFAYYSLNNDGLTFDNKTEITQIVKYTRKDKSLKEAITFSKNELILIKEQFENGKLISKIENKYDSDNNMIERIITNFKNGKTDVYKNIISYYN